MQRPSELIQEIEDNSKRNMLGDYSVAEILPLLDWISYCEEALYFREVIDGEERRFVSG